MVKDAKKLMKQFRNEVLNRSTLWLLARAQELAPSGGAGGNPYARGRKSSSSTGDLGIRLDFEIDYDRLIGKVGLPAGSELEEMGWWNEYGTGPSGAGLFVSFNGEPRPNFTLPYIVPKNSKVLAWVSHGIRPTTPAGWKQASREGRAVYAKKTKGMNPHPFLRPSLAELKVRLPEIAKAVGKEIFN